MLSDKGAIHSEIVQTIIGIISQSREPLHEFLNDSLKDLCSEEIFDELVSNPEFSMDPILESINQFLLPNSKLDLTTLENYSNFYSFMTEKLEKLSQAEQIELIFSINNCLSYCYDYDLKEESLKGILSKIVGAYRNVFKLSLKLHLKENLKIFTEKIQNSKLSEITFICREFLRENDLTEKSSDYNFMFLKLFVTTLPTTENIIPSAWISYLQIFTRRFMKFPKHSDSLNGFGLIIKMISILRTRPNNEQLSKLTSDLYPFLCNHPDILDSLILNDLFFGLDLEFFRSVKLDNNLVISFKNCIIKRLSKGHGSILIGDTEGTSLNFFDLYLKLEFEDLSNFESSQNLPPVTLDSDLLSYEVFSRLVTQNSVDLVMENLLKLWSQSYFISDQRHQIKFMNLLKISLLSLTSDSLGETLKRSISGPGPGPGPGPFTVSSLCFLTSFPFSLWRSLEKSSVISSLFTDLISIWKYLTLPSSESSIDLLALILGVISNLLSEAVDVIKKEELKQIISLLPASLTLIRNNTTMTPIMKHKSAVAMHKLLRSLLILRDDKVLDIIDHITKLGSTESSSSFFDSWKSLSLFSLVKQSRDTTRLNKTISDRIEMLIPKLFSFTEKFSNGPKLLVQHFYRHALYLHMRYTQDVNFFNNAVIQGENEQILNYIQDSSQSWSKGVFDAVAEDNIWNQLYYSCICIENDLKESPLSSLPVQISTSLRPSNSPSAILNLLKEDLLALQRCIEASRAKNDENELRKLHSALHNLLK